MVDHLRPHHQRPAHPLARAAHHDHPRRSRDGITHIAATFGFQDRTDFPEVLRRAAAANPDLLGPAGDPEQASYFLSRITLHRTRRPGLARWRKTLFIAMAHNAASQAEFLRLPADRTVVLSAEVSL